MQRRGFIVGLGAAASLGILLARGGGAEGRDACGRGSAQLDIQQIEAPLTEALYR